LGHGAAGVVGDDHHVLEAERVDEVGHDPGQARQRHVGPVAQRMRVRSERKVRGDRAADTVEPRHDAAPQVAVDPDAVDEDDRTPAAAAAELDRPRGHLDGLSLPESVAHRHRPLGRSGVAERRAVHG
jgi:hypothetical protein